MPDTVTATTRRQARVAHTLPFMYALDQVGNWGLAQML